MFDFVFVLVLSVFADHQVDIPGQTETFVPLKRSERTGSGQHPSVSRPGFFENRGDHFRRNRAFAFVGVVGLESNILIEF